MDLYVILLIYYFRWDVQRIREQRIIEKLKQRQERSGIKNEDQQHDQVNSLWPTIDDIRFLEVCDRLPVSAFGVPIPRFTSRYLLFFLEKLKRQIKNYFLANFLCLG